MRFKGALAFLLGFVLIATAFMPGAARASHQQAGLEQSVETLGALGIMSGWAGQFHEDEYFTREQLAAVVVRMKNLEDAAVATVGVPAMMYTDAPSTDWWSTRYLVVAYEQGLMLGDSTINGARAFRPDDDATLDEVVTIVIRALIDDRLTGPWPDVYRSKAIELGLVSTAGALRGSDAATRGEIAQLVFLSLSETDEGRALAGAIIDCRSRRTASPEHSAEYIRSSHYNDHYMEIRILGRTIEVSGVSSRAFDRVHVQFERDGQRLHSSTGHVASDGSYRAAISAAGLRPGELGLLVWFRDSGGNWHWAHRSPPLLLEFQVLTMVRSPVYRENLRWTSENSEVSLDDLSLLHLGDTQLARETNKGIIRALSDEITEGVDCRYDKLLAINHWVADSIHYDYDWLAVLGTEDADTSRNTYESLVMGTLELRRSVCAGYADLTVALLRAAGIPAKSVHGQVGRFIGRVDDTGGHQWVQAYVQGAWVNLDPTWNSANRYENGEYVYGGTSYTCFDVTLEWLSYTYMFEGTVRPGVGSEVGGHVLMGSAKGGPEWSCYAQPAPTSVGLSFQRGETAEAYLLVQATRTGWSRTAGPRHCCYGRVSSGPLSLPGLHTSTGACGVAVA